jgi:NADPH-dependent 7-cyano-7-deazaguanine reductase QueF
MKTANKEKSQEVETGIGITYLEQSHIKADSLKFYASESVGNMVIEAEDFSVVNPTTANPETVSLKVHYALKGKTVLKESFYEYLKSFRYVGIHQDQLTLKVYEDLKKLIGHNQITVTTFVQGDGGISVTCTESASKGMSAGY